MTSPRRHLAVADLDSRLRWVCLAGDALTAAGSVGDVALLRAPGNPSAQQLRDFGLAPEIRRVTPDELVAARDLDDCDVLLLGVMGPPLSHLITRLRARFAGAERRPLLVSGTWGITGLNDAEGLLWRTGCDLYCVNSAFDRERFSAIQRTLGPGGPELVPTGFLFAPAPPRPLTTDVPISQVLFATQTFPATRIARAHLLERLVEYAVAHPARRVVIKSRARPGEQATHVDRFPFERIAEERVGRLPPNLSFGYGPIGPHLDASDLMLTVSSAAAVEAWLRGVPVALISDFGVGDATGCNYFLGSEAFAPFDAIIADRVPQVSLRWLETHVFSPGFAPQRLAEACAERLREQSARGSALPIDAPLLTPADHPVVFAPLSVYPTRRFRRTLTSLLSRSRAFRRRE